MGKNLKSFIGNNLKVSTAKTFFRKLLVKQITLLYCEIALRICERETWTKGGSPWQHLICKVHIVYDFLNITLSRW